MKKVAEKYNGLGLSVLPVKKDKSPDVKGTWKNGIKPEEFGDAYGIGIICGEKSGGLECLDIDNHQGDAKKTLSNLIEQIKHLYHKYYFPIEETQNGGYHLFFKCNKISGNEKLASKPMLKNGKWVPDAIIETRGEGGYFVADPTPGYKIVKNKITEIPTITIEDRQHIIEICKSMNEWVDVRKDVLEESDKPGDLYNRDPESVQDMKEVLKANGWTELKNNQWQRPGKDRGISATLGKAAENIFYVFSSNAYPFNPNSGYTAFQVVGLLKYNGDFAQFAKELAEKYKPQTNERKPDKKQPEKSPDEMQKILEKAFIDLKKPVAKPPLCMSIIDNNEGQRLFTLGNFSAITGKSKSKKTMLTSMMLAAATMGGYVYNKFQGRLPENKETVILFDTEQAHYDAYWAAKRVEKIMGAEYPNFLAFDLREYDPMERCNIIGYALETMGKDVGFVVIDGIADLAKAINDEDEATRVVSLLMKWTKKYNIHITNIIHQNKNDTWATGHLGSTILKKAEAIISVTKIPDLPDKSTVKCDMIRGVKDFSDFNIEIDDGIPVVEGFNATGYKDDKTYEVPF